ncbi:MAG: Bax inhibitor-1/YccA family protein [Bdellovibrionota bacterium]
MYSQSSSRPIAFGASSSALIRSVFGWMAVGLCLTGMVSSYVLNNPDVAQSLFSPGKLIVLALLQVGLVVWLSGWVMRMSAGTATAVFLGYSALNGITLAPLAYIYTHESITSAFLTAAGMFAAMVFYGTVTKKDLSSWSSFLMMGLWGIIIASVVNIFFHSAAMAFTMSVAGVIVFTGLTAYDVNRLKQYGSGVTEGTPDFRRAAILGALSLYLDFINLFVMLLRLMGDRRN